METIFLGGWQEERAPPDPTRRVQHGTRPGRHQAVEGRMLATNDDHW